MKLPPYLFLLMVLGLALTIFLTIRLAPDLFRRGQPSVLTLAIADWPGDQAFAFVDLLQLDTQYNLALDLLRVPAEDDRLTLWRSGQVDTQIFALDVGFAMAASDDIRIIYAYDASFGADAMVAVNTIQTPGDLRGQTIGAEIGYPSHFLTLNILDKAGLRLTDVTLIDVQFDEVAAAFADGRATAITTWEPNVSELLAQNPDLHVLSSSRDFPAVIFDVVFVRASTLAANRTLYVNLIQALDAAIRHCNANLRPCLELLATESGRPAAQWETGFQGLRLLDLAANQQLFNDAGPDGLAAKLQAIYTFLRANRSEMPAFDISQWLDGSLVSEAAAQ